MEQCSVFVALNTTFQETEPDITYTIETFCQNNCSGRGMCNAGKPFRKIGCLKRNEIYAKLYFCIENTTAVPFKLFIYIRRATKYFNQILRYAIVYSEHRRLILYLYGGCLFFFFYRKLHVQ